MGETVKAMMFVDQFFIVIVGLSILFLVIQACIIWTTVPMDKRLLKLRRKMTVYVSLFAFFWGGVVSYLEIYGLNMTDFLGTVVWMISYLYIYGATISEFEDHIRKSKKFKGIYCYNLFVCVNFAGGYMSVIGGLLGMLVSIWCSYPQEEQVQRFLCPFVTENDTAFVKIVGKEFVYLGGNDSIGYELLSVPTSKARVVYKNNPKAWIDIRGNYYNIHSAIIYLPNGSRIVETEEYIGSCSSAVLFKRTREN